MICNASGTSCAKYEIFDILIEVLLAIFPIVLLLLIIAGIIYIIPCNSKWHTGNRDKF